MEYMLDTDTCSYIIKKVPEVLQAFSNHLETCCISSVVYQELMVGLVGVRGTKHEEAYVEFMRLIKVIPFSQTDALAAADFMVSNKKMGHNIGVIDNQIAGQAANSGLTLVTNNTNHFAPMAGLEITSWVG